MTQEQHSRISNERMLRGVPAEGTDTELDDGELINGIFDLEVANIGAVELEGLPPWSAGDSGHFEVNGDEVRGSDMVAELSE